MSKELFKRGYKAVVEEKARQEEERKNRQFGLWDFYVKGDGEEADFVFLTEEPVNWDSHTIQRSRNGKTYYDTILCTGEDCEYCADGDRPRFVGSYLVVDLRPYTYKKNGEDVTVDFQLRLYTQGTKVLSQLDRSSSKYGLVDRLWTLVRVGTGQSTTWSFERGDEQPLSPEEIKEVLPENMQEKYDGKMESLYSIIGEQIMAKAPDSDDKEEEEETEEEMKDKLVGVSDKKETKKKTNSLFKGKSSSKKKTTTKATIGGKKPKQENKKRSFKSLL